MNRPNFIGRSSTATRSGRAHSRSKLELLHEPLRSRSAPTDQFRPISPTSPAQADCFRHKINRQIYRSELTVTSNVQVSLDSHRRRRQANPTGNRCIVYSVCQPFCRCFRIMGACENALTLGTFDAQYRPVLWNRMGISRHTLAPVLAENTKP